MNRFLFVVALLAAGCQGTEGPAGPAGPAGPVGPQGPAGPVGDPPEVLSIAPEVGSARTIWTIEGKNFAATAAGNTVWFDGEKARVLSASTTELRVTDAFAPVDAPEVRSVTVEAANQLSNAHSVFAFPSGTLRERGEKSVWSEARTFAPALDSIYVADVNGAVFRHDRTTLAIERVAESENDGLGSVRRVFLGPMGELWISEFRSTPAGSLWRLLESTNDGWSPILLMPNEPILAVPNDGANAWAVGTRTAKRVDGAAEAQLPADAFAAAISGDFLFVTHPSTGRVSAVSMDGGVTDCGFVLPDPRGILSLGDNFVLVAADDGYHVATIGQADEALEIPGLSLEAGEVVQMERLGDAEFFFLAGAIPRVMLVDMNGAVTIAASGIRAPTSLARSGEELFVADFGTCFFDEGTGVFAGALLAVKDDGSARTVSTTACVAAGIATEPGGATAIYADAFSNLVARVDLTAGTTTPVATIDDGVFSPVGVAIGPGGEAYVAHFSLNDGLAAIAKIDAAVDPSFALCPDSECFSTSVTASGDSLFMASSGALWSADLANGGDWMELTPRALALAPQLDALEPDGADGVWLSDVTTATILRWTANGELVTASTGSEWSGIAGPLEPNRRNGDLEVGDLSPVGGRPLSAMLP